MNHPLDDKQAFLQLRREFDEFRDETRATLKQIDKDTDMISDHSLYVQKQSLDSSKQIGDHIKRIYSDVDMIYDMIGPLDQAVFPQVNSVRGILETIREELAKIKSHGSAENRGDHSNDQADDPPQE